MDLVILLVSKASFHSFEELQHAVINEDHGFLFDCINVCSFAYSCNDQR